VILLLLLVVVPVLCESQPCPQICLDGSLPPQLFVCALNPAAKSEAADKDQKADETKSKESETKETVEERDLLDEKKITKKKG